jgi:hypothetical protein
MFSVRTRIVVVATVGIAAVVGCIAHECESTPIGPPLETPGVTFLRTKISSAVMKRLDTGENLPCQLEGMGIATMASWIASTDPRARYKLQPVNKPPAMGGNGVKLVKTKNAVDVRIDGQLFTSYVFSGVPKPYYYPIIGPGGKPVTRGFPMKDVPGETKDHPHHRSMWFTFGSVNGVDFWTESPQAGRIVHRKFDKLVSGPVYGRIRSVNDWIGPDGKKVCEGDQEIYVYRLTGARIADYTVRVWASEGPLTFGNTKEGMFAIRVADSMTVDKGKGHIQLSTGEKDAAAWGKKADWCDYYGPVDGKTVGIAVMTKPDSGSLPPYWHVRTYGLLAENPFGIRDYTGDKTRDASITIRKGDGITFKYRVFIHDGDTLQGRVADQYAAYIKPPTATSK